MKLTKNRLRKAALVALLATCAVIAVHGQGRDPITPVHMWAEPEALVFPWWDPEFVWVYYNAAYAQPSDWRATHVNLVVYTIKVSVGNEVFYEQRGGTDTLFFAWLNDKPWRERLFTSFGLSKERFRLLKRLYDAGAVVKVEFEEDDLTRFGSGGRGAYDIVSNEPPDWCRMGCVWQPVPALPIGFVGLGALLMLAVRIASGGRRWN